MSTKEDEEKPLAEIGLGKLLDVAPITGGYVETNIKGERKQYESPSIDTIEIRNLNVLKFIDVTTGDSYFYLHGVTKHVYRPVGAEKAFKLNVRLSPRLAPNKAVISMTLAVANHGFYNSFGFTLHVGLPQAALEQIVVEARAATTSRALRLVLSAPAFYHGEGSISEPVEVLSYWGDQLQPKKHRNDFKWGDSINVEWSFDIREVIVSAEFANSFFASEFADKKVDASVYARGDISVSLNQQREQAITYAYEAILAHFKSLRSTLMLIAIAVIIIAIRLWWR